MPVESPERYRHYRRYFINIGALYQKKQVKVYTEIVLSILMVAFFGFFAIRPTLVTISGLFKEIKDKKEIVTQMDQKINNLSKAQANYNQVKNRLYLVDEALPQDPALSLLIKQVESLARVSSVNLESVKFNKTNLQGETGKEEAQEVTFSLAFSGDYKNLKQFLNSLDTLRRVILVESFAFKSQTEKEVQLLTLTVNARAYCLTNK